MDFPKSNRVTKILELRGKKSLVVVCVRVRVRVYVSLYILRIPGYPL